MKKIYDICKKLDKYSEEIFYSSNNLSTVKKEFLKKYKNSKCMKTKDFTRIKKYKNSNAFIICKVSDGWCFDYIIYELHYNQKTKKFDEVRKITPAKERSLLKHLAKLSKIKKR